MEFLKRNLPAAFVALLIACAPGNYEPQTGDIVLQDLKSPSSEAIKLATNSPYSHCGLVSLEGDSAFVIEAVGPVRKIPLEQWTENGEGLYSVLRFKEGNNVDEAIRIAEKYLGLPYDQMYLWGDDEFYCSELVYKAYSRGCGISLCDLRRFEEYNLELVKRAIIERFGEVPVGQKVVTPEDLAHSPLLEIIYSNMKE
jgi:uncharacterized protein YycO